MGANACRRCGAPTNVFGDCAVCKRQDAMLREQERQTEEQQKQTRLLQKQADVARDQAAAADRQRYAEAAAEAMRARAAQEAELAQGIDELAKRIIQDGESLAASFDAADGPAQKMKALAEYGEGRDLISLEVWSLCHSRLPYQFGEAYGRLRASTAKAITDVWRARDQFPASAHTILKRLAESFLFPDLGKAAGVAKQAADAQRAVVSIVRAAEEQEKRAETLRELRGAVVTRTVLDHHRRKLAEIGAPVDSSDERLRSGLGRALLSVLLFMPLLFATATVLGEVEPKLAPVLSALDESGRRGVQVAVALGVPLAVVVWLNVRLSRFLLRRSQLRVIDFRVYEVTDQAQKIRAALPDAETGLEALAKRLRSLADPNMWEVATPAWFGELTMPKEMQKVG